MDSLSTEAELNDIIGTQGDVLTNSSLKGDTSKNNNGSVINSTQTNAGSNIQENKNEDNIDSNMEKVPTKEDLFNQDYYNTPLENNLQTYRKEVISTRESFRDVQINLTDKRMLLKNKYKSCRHCKFYG